MARARISRSRPWIAAGVPAAISSFFSLKRRAGWLVLTHGVGAMRNYCIGAALLDLDDPRKVIGRLQQPLLVPHDHERDGYVPNVVYSCGSLIQNGCLVLPHAVNDYATTNAVIPLEPLLERLVQS